MKKLSEALPNIKRNADLEKQSVNTSSMEVHGLTTMDGKMNTSSSQTSLSVHKTQQLGGIYEPKTLTSDEKKKLTILITTCFNGLKSYKTPDQLEAVIMLMQMKLVDKPYKHVRAAFMSHMDESAEIPTPYDILKRIPKPIASNGLTEKQERQRKRIREEQNNC